ncbi:MAG TPA: MG2 domain-containing protein, partial [Terriglobia bacterium]|nr:MG2 domain-containing protein [Terriglobia bacterium]
MMVLVEKDDDFSFLPMASNGRQLDFSRFDTGGVENAQSPQSLSTYLFTDRGIYRPGETTHLALVTRTADWTGTLAGLPLEVEITDPRGTIVNRSSLKLSATALEEIAYRSQPASPTGIYQATAFLVKDQRRRELLGSTSFKVQEFEPDRMKVQLTLTDQPANAWLNSADVLPRTTVAHLFGEPASGRRVDGEISLTPVLPEFARYPDYRFQIGEGIKEPYRENLPAGVTDDKGIAQFKLSLGRFAGRAYRLSVLVRAYEAEGGRNVAAQTSAIVSDAPFLVGVKPDGDLSYVRRSTTHQAHWLAVNKVLAPVTAENLTLEWVQRKYLSVLTQQDNKTYKYVSKLKEIVRDTKSVSIAAGGTNFALPTEEPGDFVLVLKNASGAELNRLSYSVAGQANVSRSLERNAELQVQLDKSSYAGGDTIEVSIRAPYVGSGLITVERDQVFRYRWFKTTTTSTVQRIQLPQDFEGNGYVTVQFLRDPSSDELFLSPLSYGVAGFSANLDARTQPVTVTAPQQVKPGTPMTIRVTASEASKAVVLAVDEGILQVARYKNPNPLGYFFQKRMLEVETRQILDLLLPEYKRFMALAAPGGDEDGGFARHLNPFARKRKPPVAYWSGLIDVGPEGRNLTYTVPDYFNGKLRIVAVVVGARRVGVADRATEVKGDFILTPNVPAMVSPGDEFIVSVGVFNNTTGGSGPVQVEAQTGAELTAVGTPRMELQIEDKKEGVAEFRFKANTTLGSAPIRFAARRGPAEARMEETTSVRPATPYRTQLTLGLFTGSQEQTALHRDLYSEQRQVEASVSSLPLVWGEGLRAYLDSYTYTCTEQLISKSMSALIITSRPEFGVVRGRET